MSWLHPQSLRFGSREMPHDFSISGVGQAPTPSRWPGSHPTLQGLVIDQSVAVARRLIRQQGLADRLKVRTGNLFTLPLATGFDVALLSNVLHDFSEKENLRLLRRVYQSLRPGGKLFIVEYFLNPAGIRPAEAAIFSLLMYAFTDTGRCYAWKESEGWLATAGFSRCRRHRITGTIGTLEAVKR
jgi:SAM-dependent methyltransferase